ncbi:MAG: hypothetical protein F4X57_11180 [Chloroflexi bacterium]|nr:hypothetical protein [Chloroflexota bacterium]
MTEQAGYPPRVNVSVEELARATLRRARPRKIVGRVYRCVACGEVVEWPQVLGDDVVCGGCASAQV